MKLNLGPIYSTLLEAPLVLRKQLSDIFAVAVKGYWYMPAYKQGVWDGKIRFFSSSQGRILTGLVPRLLAELRKEGLEIEVIDANANNDVSPQLRLKLGSYDLEHPPYEYQAEAVRIALEKKRGILRLATNAGKTIVAASIIASLNLPTLYVCGSQEILWQTEKLFREIFGAKKIGVVGGGSKSTGFITLALVPSIVRRGQFVGKPFEAVKVLVFDEAHHSSSETWRQVGLGVKASYRYGLSATPFGDVARDYYLEGLTGPNLIGISNNELIERGVSAVPTVQFIPSNAEPLSSGWSFASAYRKAIVESEGRADTTARVARALSDANRRTLILTLQVKHARRLHGQLPEARCNHGSLSKTKRLENQDWFRSTPGSILLATTIYDEGVSIPEVEALILAGGGRSARKLLQRVGRALRKKEQNEVIIVDFIDSQHPTLFQHSKARLNTYLQEGFKVLGKDDFKKAKVERKRRSKRKRKENVEQINSVTLTNRAKQILNKLKVEI